MKEISYPALYLAADASAKENQRNFFVALAVNLMCLAIASALSVVNLPASWFGALQAIVLLISLALSTFLSTKQPQRLWYGTRALAESVKTITWRFMMRAEPFEDEQEARRNFLASLRKILESNAKISSLAAEMQDGLQITSSMLSNRSLTLADRKTIYQKQRIIEQQSWYIAKARTNSKLAKWWFVGLIAVNSLAIALSLARIIYPTIDHWPTDFLVAVASSVMAWIQTKRFQELSGSYTLTAHEIGLLRETMPEGNDEREFSVFVADSENAFSREHTQWAARRDAE